MFVGNDLSVSEGSADQVVTPFANCNRWTNDGYVAVCDQEEGRKKAKRCRPGGPGEVICTCSFDKRRRISNKEC